MKDNVLKKYRVQANKNLPSQSNLFFDVWYDGDPKALIGRVFPTTPDDSYRSIYNDSFTALVVIPLSVTSDTISRTDNVITNFSTDFS